MCSPDGSITIEIANTDIEPHDAEERESARTYEASQLVVSARIGNTPRYITFPDQAKFETNENDKIDYVLKHYVSRSYVKSSFINNWAHAFENAKSFVVISLVAVVIASWAFVQFGIPYFSQQIAHALPTEFAQDIGSGGLALLDETLTSESEIPQGRQADLNRQFESLLPIDTQGYHFELVFRKSEALGANAFAFPSGEILFTDAMINIAAHDDELKTIMLHEIGHVIHRHSLQKMIQQSGLALIVFLLTGDAGTTSSIIATLPTLLLEANYSQNMETEADTYALAHLDQHAIKPIHFANIMMRIHASTEPGDTVNTNNAEEESNLRQYFSTHPATEERISRFKDE